MWGNLAIETFKLGITNIHLHKLRSLLTTLGIICGVGAVICMLSISEGASEAEMRLIRLLGTHNIIVQSVPPQGAQSVTEEHARMMEYGLTRRDLEVVRGTIPRVRRVVSLREVAFEVSHGARRLGVSVVGTEPDFFEVINIEFSSGRPLLALDQQEAKQVCVLGAEVAARLFAYEDPLGRCISVNSATAGMVPFEVIGVLKKVETAGLPAKGIGERDLNHDVYIPMSTAERRYSDIRVQLRSGGRNISRCEYSDFFIEVEELEHVRSVAEMVSQALSSAHRNQDYTIKVPLERLQIAESEKRRRQITLGAIAGISLLVGGIGIMNIMLATVTERTREIGIRRALGAKRRHITIQFLVESVVLTTVGGILGVVCGSAGAHLITQWAGWPTVIHHWTIMVSFSLAVAVGVFFGIYPAATAARLDPIEALRHE